MSHPIEKKAKNLHETFQEMFPFLFFTALPILLIVVIAFTFGSTR